MGRLCPRRRNADRRGGREAALRTVVVSEGVTGEVSIMASGSNDRKGATRFELDLRETQIGYNKNVQRFELLDLQVTN